MKPAGEQGDGDGNPRKCKVRERQLLLENFQSPPVLRPGIVVAGQDQSQKQADQPGDDNSPGCQAAAMAQVATGSQAGAGLQRPHH